MAQFKTAHRSSSVPPSGPRASRWLTDRPSAQAAPFAAQLDTWLQGMIARGTWGASPASMAGAGLDWLTHLSMSPGRGLELAELGARQWQRLSGFARTSCDSDCKPCIEPLPQDNRFRDERWQQWPYNIAAQSFLLAQQWTHAATNEVPGVSRHHADMVTFAARQMLDMVAPSNFISTNPVLTDATIREGGANLLRGAEHWREDMQRLLAGERPYGTDAFPVGEKVAITPGKVVLRNGLAELIQYRPSTASVYPEPLLIVAAWIMKYYILDLQAHNSLIKFLVDRGHTVFVISWKNPGEADRDMGMDDYLRLGPLAAIDAIRAIMPGRKIHAVGYCLGGTLTAIAAASLARRKDNPLATLTLLAAQVDFAEPGELSLFIDEGQVSFLEHMMRAQGYLDTTQMAEAFRLLRSSDLIWSYRINNYLLGKRDPPSDMMAWNADGTRLPYRMHSEYLRALFLRNELAGGQYRVDGRPVALTDIRIPLFAVGTLYDHVSPWRSVYKIHLLTDTEATFALTTGGHNMGIVAPPGNGGNHHGPHHFQMQTRRRDTPYHDAATWLAEAPTHEGSWWLAWESWLAAHSGRRVKPPAPGSAKAGYASLGPAPGTYVLGS